MKKRKWGRIINIASAHGLVASPQKVAYVTAKHGVVGMTKVVALEAAQDGITVNAICPGWVFTPLVDKQAKDRAAKEGKNGRRYQTRIAGRKNADDAVHDGRANRRLVGVSLFAERG